MGGEMKCTKSELGEERATPLSWNEITSTIAEELVRQEQRKAILLRPPSATKITRVELRERHYNLHSMGMHWRPTSGCGEKTTSGRSTETKDSASPGSILRRTERVRSKQAKLQTCWLGVLNLPGVPRMTSRGLQGARDRKFMGV